MLRFLFLICIISTFIYDNDFLSNNFLHFTILNEIKNYFMSFYISNLKQYYRKYIKDNHKIENPDDLPIYALNNILLGIFSLITSLYECYLQIYFFNITTNLSKLWEITLIYTNIMNLVSIDDYYIHIKKAYKLLNY